MSARFSRHDRDAGLHRIGAITRWALAGALAGTGFFAGLASRSGSGSASGRAGTSRPVGTTTGNASVAAAPNDDGGFTAPTPLPAPAVAPASGFAPIVSGAS